MRALRATCCNAVKPATTRPKMTAVTKSSATVATAVTINTTASPRVDRSNARTLDTSTICTAVANKTPASAASGIELTHLDPTNTTTSSTSE